jgi:putative DNA primase/helicase
VKAERGFREKVTLQFLTEVWGEVVIVSDGSISIRDLALEYVKGGLSVVPIKADGSKSPVGSWKKFQEHLPAPYDIKQNFKGNVGIAILGGKVSGSLEIIDFDHPDYIEPWVKVVEENSAGLTAKLTRIKTPRGGAHFYFRCSEIEGNQKLAQEPTVDSTTGKPSAKVLIETRGEGGYVLAPGCPAACHPTGKLYEYVSGPKLTEIATITPEERRVLLDSARSFNRIPKQVKVHTLSGKKGGKGGLRPGDDFNMRATWEEVLTPHGWKPVKKQGDSVHWCRPGKDDSTTSATTGHCGDNFYVFSSNAHPFEPDTAYSKFSAFTVLAHNGDFEAAAKDLAGKGYGTKPEKKTRKSVPEDEDPWWNGKKFLPKLLAEALLNGHRYIATPIGKDKGIDIYLYEDGAYRLHGASFAETQARELMRDRADGALIDKTMDMICRMTKTEYPKINRRARELINVKNGMLDWSTGKLYPHDPDMLSTIQINAEYDPDAKSPELEKFFKEIFPDDTVHLIEEFMGYLLIPDTSFEKAFIAVGSGGNGKSTFLKVLRFFLDERNVSTVSLYKMGEKDRFDAAALFGKLANIFHDLKTGFLDSTEMFKLVTTGDPISVEKKYKDPFTFVPFARLVFSTNQFPKVNDHSEAFLDRLVFIPFPNRFRGTSQQIRKYDEVLVTTKGVLPSLLLHAISGLRRLMDRKVFTIPEVSKTALESYRRECNSAYDFIRESCSIRPGGWISKKSLYQIYFCWTRDSGVKPLSKRNFNQTVEGMSVQETARDGYPGWSGLAWISGFPPEVSSEEIKKVDEMLDKHEARNLELEF